MKSAKFKVVNAVSNGVISKKWEVKLNRLLRKISASSHRLAANYRPENMDLAGHLSFELLINSKNQIVSFAGVYNGGRFPSGVYRILNRTWVAESLRVSHGAFPYITSKYILPVQIKKLRPKLKMIFVSREDPSGKFFLRKWRSRRADAKNWTVSRKMYQVVPGVNKPSCFQYICSRKLQPVSWKPLKITEAQWAKL